MRDESAEPIPKPSRPIQVGDLVEIPGTRRQAEVTAVKDGTLTLKTGVLQMKVKADEVRLIEAAERAANQYFSHSTGIERKETDRTREQEETHGTLRFR